MNNDWIIVAKHLSFYETHAIVAEFDANGINSIVIDSSHVETIYAPLGMMPMGVIMVHPTDEQNAIEIISEFEKRKPEEDVDDPEDKQWRKTCELDATVRRSFTAALAGLICVPYLFHIYSLSLLIRLRSDFPSLSKTVRWKGYLTIGIDLIVLVVTGLTVGSIYGGIAAIVTIAGPIVLLLLLSRL